MYLWHKFQFILKRSLCFYYTVHFLLLLLLLVSFACAICFIFYINLNTNSLSSSDNTYNFSFLFNLGFLVHIYIYTFIYIQGDSGRKTIFFEVIISFIVRRTSLYTGCPGGNVPYFGRMFLTLKYTDITKNTYIRS